jgi:hypothetical protein
MHIEAIAKKPSTDNQINWVTAFFMVSFHIGAIASVFSLLGRLCWSQVCFGGFREAWGSV